MAPAPVAAAPQPAPEQAAPADAAPAQPAKKSNALKIILIVLGVLVLIGVLIVGAVAVGGYFAYKKGKEVLQSQQTTNGEVNINTPFGDINTSEDAGKIAAQMGVAVYPGATPLTEGTASSSFGGISVMSAAFETGDSIDQVEQFYKAKFPSASVSASEDNKRAMVFGTPKGLVTLTLRSLDGKTKIDISRLEGDGKSGASSSE